jgi:hypothetical protein
MSQPPQYTPATNFQQEETNAVAGRSTLRNAMLDAELAALRLSVNALVTNIALIQRDDGQLRDTVVTIASLSSAVSLLIAAGGFTPRGTWLTATVYAFKDIVETGSPTTAYVCVTAHTSGTFATDLAAGKWMTLSVTPSAYIRTLLDDADAPAARSTLGFPAAGTSGYVLADSLVWTPYASAAYNAIIGGDFSSNPFQRGTSFASAADGTFAADRFFYSKTGTMVHDISKSANAPTVAQCGRLVTHCLLVDCTTADAAIAAADFCLVEHRVEGYNFVPLAQGAMAFQFWHAHTKTGIYCVAFRNTGNNQTCVIEYTQAVSDAWELATAIVPASPAAGTWDYTNGIGIAVRFALACGTDRHAASAGSWLAVSALATANQVNACDSTANNFRIALIDLRPGSIVLPVQSRTYRETLELSRRYYRKSYNDGVTPGTITDAGADQSIALSTTDFYDFGDKYLRGGPMRAAPTITTRSSSTGTAGVIRNLSAGADITPTVSNVSQSKYNISGAAANLVVGNAYRWHWEASAEL